MKQKYIDERYPIAFCHGVTHDGKLTNVCDINEGLSVLVRTEDADNLVVNYNRLQRAIVDLALAFNAAAPEDFEKFWYGR